MKTYSFENMLAWKETRVLVKISYVLSQSFPKEEIYGLTSQLRRSVVSISSNLAEGSARLGDKDQKNFYKMAYSSAMEALSQIILAGDLDYVSSEEIVSFRTQLDKVTYLINKLREGI